MIYLVVFLVIVLLLMYAAYVSPKSFAFVMKCLFITIVTAIIGGFVLTILFEIFKYIELELLKWCLGISFITL